MATVKDAILRFIRIADPSTAADVEITSANVGTVAGGRFTAQRQLDIYNQARFAVFGAFESSLPTPELTKRISGLVAFEEDLRFTVEPDRSYAARPAGYVRFISMHDRSNGQIFLLHGSLKTTVLSGSNPDYTQAQKRRFIFEEGVNLVHYGAFIPNATSFTITGATNATPIVVTTGSSHGYSNNDVVYIQGVTGNTAANGKFTIANVTSTTFELVGSVGNGAYVSGGVVTKFPIQLAYFKIVNWALSDVTGSTVETINDDYHAQLIEVAVAIADGQGHLEAQALAKKLLGLP